MSSATRTFTRRDSILFAACVALAFIARQLPDRMRDPLAASLRRSILAPLVALQRNAELSRAAWVTREQRTAERDSVALRAMALTAVQHENERLRKLLGLGEQLKWGFVPAEVIGGRSIGEEYTVALSAGARAGVKRFSPVVAPEGLVGMVKSVDPAVSIAIVWAHPDFRVSAMSEDGSAFGIVGAHLGNEPESYLLEMRGVPMRSTLTPGTLIVSSGLGSTFPRGIPIGTVLTEVKTPELWARTYLLRPAVSPSDVSAVMVLLPERVASGVETVWRSGRSADSATRSVAAAGDSLARVAEAASASARAASAPGDSSPRPPAAVARSAAHADSSRRAGAPRSDSARRVRADSARRVIEARRDSTGRKQP